MAEGRAVADPQGAGGDAATKPSALARAALPELADEPFAQVELGRLEQIRLDALEDHIEAELSLGRHAQAIETLERLVSRHPYRERSRALLMLAPHRSGRQADALDAYRDARRALVDDLGIEPGPQLRELHEAILAQDPAIDGAGGAERCCTGRSHRGRPRAASKLSHPEGSALPAAGLAILPVAAAVLIVVLTGDDRSPQPLTDDSHAVAVIDPDSGHVTRAASVGTNPGLLASIRNRAPCGSGTWTTGRLPAWTCGRSRPAAPSRTQSGPRTSRPATARSVAGAPRTKPFVTARRIDARFDTRSEPVRIESLPEERQPVPGGARWWRHPAAG